MKGCHPLRPQKIFLVAVLALLLASCGGGQVPVEADVASTTHPLVAQYTVKSPKAGKVFVEFGPATSYGFETAMYDIDADGTLPILVAGMKPSTTYHMRATLLVGGNPAWKDEDRVFATGRLDPSPPPPLTVTRGNGLRQKENGGVEMIAYFPAAGGPTLQTFVTDRDGNVIWYYDPPGATTAYMKPMPNGHFFVAVNVSATTASTIREVDLAGHTVRELDAPTLTKNLHNAGYALDVQGLHHDAALLDNGHIIVLGQTTKNFTDLPGYPGTTAVQGDVLVDLDQNWNPVWTWNAFDYLDVNRHLMGLPDWTHSNAVVYNPADGNLMLSVRHQSWILGIDYRNGAGSGQILWKLGQDGDFALIGSNPSDWFYAQHFPKIVNSSGSKVDLAVFDNGNLRVMDYQGTTCGAPPAPGCYTRATLFRFDQDTRQAELRWDYSPGFFSFWGGAINQLPNGNIEFEMSAPFPVPMVGSRVMEVTQSATPDVVWQMDIGDGFSYRAYRIPSLYPHVWWP